jgi:ABC-type transport system involved in multi-copper enzyme maturation permease subunit
MRAVLTVAGISIKESVRDRVFLGLLLFVSLLLGFSVYLSTLSLGDVARVMQNMGMASLSLIGLTVTLLFGLYSLYQEQERNELFILLNRISRGQYLGGRFLGASFIIALFILIMGTALFLLTWFIGGIAAPLLFLNVFMSILEFSFLMAIGLLFYASGIRFTLNALLVIAVFILGHSFNEAIHSFVALGTLGDPGHLLFIKALSYALPNFDLFDFRLAIVHSQTIALGKIIFSLLYWACYLGAILLFARILFIHRDLS